MKITKEDFEILHWIEYMNYNDLRLLSETLGITKEDAEKKLLELEKRKLIKIEYRENKIYGSQLTEEGKKIWDDDNYLKWKLELGY